MLGRADNVKSAATVNEVAAEPKKYLGSVEILGVVAIVTPDKGFVLVDKREYTECGLSCLAEKATKKIPIQWSGTPPKLEDAVRVKGILSESEEGLSFAAKEIVKQ